MTKNKPDTIHQINSILYSADRNEYQLSQNSRSAQTPTDEQILPSRNIFMQWDKNHDLDHVYDTDMGRNSDENSQKICMIRLVRAISTVVKMFLSRTILRL